jgi:UDP-N-acetylmuramate dehydrogenase
VSLSPHQARWLAQRFGRRARFNVPMRRLTWLRVGGPAWALVSLRRMMELEALAAWAEAEKVPCFLLGGGSNLLVRDGGLEAVVLRLCGDFRRVVVTRPRETAVLVEAMAGAPLAALCRQTAAADLSGMEFAAGIPGTVGGAIVMNAGSGGGCVADVLQGIDLLLAGGTHRSLERRELRFSYRSLAMQGIAPPAGPLPPVVLRGRFLLRQDAPGAAARRVETLLERRRASQPLDLPSAGCFFKNPGGERSAGALIDLAGLKGLRIGGAEVSTRHGNFIVNRGGATAADILALKGRIEERVRERFGIQLDTEVHIVGF